MNKNFTLIICALTVLGVGVVLLSSRPSPRAPSTPQTVATSSVATTTEQGQSERVVPLGMREYRSTAYHFSLLYPQELTVSERQEGGGAATITFQNIEKAEGFQIFIVPYSESQVSAKRFQQDEPSGVRESLSNIVVDGATAAAFYSTNTALGATREVWVVHGGFLYEVTTLKSLDTWLGGVIQNWKFI